MKLGQPSLLGGYSLRPGGVCGGRVGLVAASVQVSLPHEHGPPPECRLQQGTQQVLDQLTHRRAKLRDGANLVDLIQELAGPADRKATMRRYRRMVIRPSYHLFVTLDGTRPVALTAFRSGYFFGADAPHLQFIALVVDPEFRRLGIAHDSMAYAFARFEGGGYCQIWMVTQQTHLHPMYEELGFGKTGTRFMRPVTNDPPAASLQRIRRSVVRRLGF